MSSSFAPGSIIVGALFSISPLCPDVFAAEPPRDVDFEPVKFTFQFNRNDLTDDKGKSRVRKALVARARKACTLPGEPSISLQRTDTSCVAQLVDRVSAQLGLESKY